MDASLIMSIMSADVARSLLTYDDGTGEIAWRVGRLKGQRAGSINGQGYTQIKVGGRIYLAHRVAWLLKTGEWPSLEIDHSNGVKADNCWLNLRAADRYQNAQNVTRAQKSASGYRGVIAKGGAWQAQIRASGRNHYLGIFKTAVEAHRAYRAAAELLHGQFARSA